MIRITKPCDYIKIVICSKCDEYTYGITVGKTYKVIIVSHYIPIEIYHHINISLKRRIINAIKTIIFPRSYFNSVNQMIKKKVTELEDNSNDISYCVINDFGEEGYYDSSYFLNLEEWRDNQLDKLGV